MKRTPHGGSGTGDGQIVQAELLKLQKSGQFPDEPVRIKGFRPSSGARQRFCNQHVAVAE